MFDNKKYSKEKFVIIHKKRILDRHILKIKDYLPLTDNNCKMEYDTDSNEISSLAYKLYSGYLDLFDLKVYKTLNDVDEENNYVITDIEQLYKDNDGKISVQDAINSYNLLILHIKNTLDQMTIKRINKMVKVKSKHG